MVCSIDISHEKVGIDPVGYILNIANSFKYEVAVKVQSNSNELLVDPELSKIKVKGSVDVKVTYLGKTVPPQGTHFLRIFMIPFKTLSKISANNWTTPDNQPLPHGRIYVNYERKPMPVVEDKGSEDEKAEDLRIAREHCRLCQPSTSGLRKWMKK